MLIHLTMGRCMSCYMLTACENVDGLFEHVALRFYTLPFLAQVMQKKKNAKRFHGSGAVITVHCSA